MDNWDQLLDELNSCSPTRAIELVPRLRELSGVFGKLPIQASRMFLPGLNLPANQLLVLPNVPNLAAGGTESGQIPLQLQTPGLIVGVWGAVSVTNTDELKTNTGFQIRRDQSWALVGNGSANNAFASMGMFTSTCPWYPLLWPVSGNSQLTVQFRNDNAGTAVTPRMQFAFLAATRAL